jgi:hypothetical protein
MCKPIVRAVIPDISCSFRRGINKLIINPVKGSRIKYLRIEVVIF